MGNSVVNRGYRSLPPHGCHHIVRRPPSNPFTYVEQAKHYRSDADPFPRPNMLLDRMARHSQEARRKSLRR